MDKDLFIIDTGFGTPINSMALNRFLRLIGDDEKRQNLLQEFSRNPELLARFDDEHNLPIGASDFLLLINDNFFQEQSSKIYKKLQEHFDIVIDDMHNGENLQEILEKTDWHFLEGDCKKLQSYLEDHYSDAFNFLKKISLSIQHNHILLYGNSVKHRNVAAIPFFVLAYFAVGIHSAVVLSYSAVGLLNIVVSVTVGLHFALALWTSVQLWTSSSSQSSANAGINSRTTVNTNSGINANSGTGTGVGSGVGFGMSIDINVGTGYGIGADGA
ncbi:MAG: hypothetical protein LBG58_14520 [Planctomycetaceae bacterium]|jgi:hypothetical protein|nr:hypothetical protein [Planctomycetaceae bacterium]